MLVDCEAVAAHYECSEKRASEDGLLSLEERGRIDLNRSECNGMTVHILGDGRCL
jgi:hypothetical protein